MLKELKETMFKGLKKSSTTVFHQMERISNETEICIFSKSQAEILELKSIITEMKSSLEGPNNVLELTEEKNRQT